MSIRPISNLCFLQRILSRDVAIVRDGNIRLKILFVLECLQVPRSISVASSSVNLPNCRFDIQTPHKQTPHNLQPRTRFTAFVVKNFRTFLWCHDLQFHIDHVLSWTHSVIGKPSTFAGARKYHGKSQVESCRHRMRPAVNNQSNHCWLPV
jgi:hypothetical protein